MTVFPVVEAPVLDVLSDCVIPVDPVVSMGFVDLSPGTSVELLEVVVFASGSTVPGLAGVVDP